MSNQRSGELDWPNGPLFTEIDPNDKAALIAGHPTWRMKSQPFDEQESVFLIGVTVEWLTEELVFTGTLPNRALSDPAYRDKWLRQSFREVAREAVSRKPTDLGAAEMGDGE